MAHQHDKRRQDDDDQRSAIEMRSPKVRREMKEVSSHEERTRLAVSWPTKMGGYDYRVVGLTGTRSGCEINATRSITVGNDSCPRNHRFYIR